MDGNGDADGTDLWAVEHDYVSITPLPLDLTDRSELDWAVGGSGARVVPGSGRTGSHSIASSAAGSVAGEAFPVGTQRMEAIDRYLGATCGEGLGIYGFISDADWLNYRLERARRRVDRLEVEVVATREYTSRWFEAERRLRFAREEVDAYVACLSEVRTGE